MTDQTPLSDISAITEQLRLIRLVSQQRRYPGRVLPQLPSRAEIAQIQIDTVGLLYPRHFGPAGLTAEATDAHVARMLISVRSRLAVQLRLEFMLAEGSDSEGAAARAHAIADAYLSALVRVRDVHDTDISAAFAGDPSAKSLDEVVFCFPGLAAILRHRLAHELHRHGATMTARIMAELSHSLTGIDIHPGAKIGPAFFVDHGTGVVIGETTVIGRNVRLYQHVTLGAKRFEVDETGALVKGQPRHPVLEDDVVIYAGATVLGRVTVGRGSSIGGGVWLTHSVAPGSTVTQAKPLLDVAQSGL
ncbi:serine acetyltransferase [Gemmobacter aquaticus]|uniref:serine O-acetyltransferase n=1 Tax=Gemmobacter aquaticus TaxID=490185 RepID=A0A917YN03_9RHOB|nr:serine acetyltransferase [Gemmobacter aquaticus]GGO39111.1 serine acetyltransferase [Gemmobacter aquaticus]